MKQNDTPKTPWFIWLSILGLIYLQFMYSSHYMTTPGRWEDQNLNRWLGYTARLFGLFIGVFFVPVVLMGYLLPDSWPAKTCAELVYTYFAFVFVTWRLYRYLSLK